MINNFWDKGNFFRFYPLFFIFLSVTPLFETLGKTILYLLLLILIFSIKCNYKKKDIYLFLIILFSILIISSFIDLITNSGIVVSKMNLFFAFNILVGFILSQNYTKEDVLLLNEKLVKIFVIIGLPLHFLLLYKPDLINYFVEYNYGNTTHKTLFFINAHISNETYEGRFMSFAWEPGIMQMYLNLALFTRLNFMKNRFDIISILIIIAIFCTYSTAGYIILFSILLLKGHFFNVKVLFLFLLISPFIYTAINQAIEYQLTYKLINSNSFDGRYGRLFNMLSKWEFKDLFFGKGGLYYDIELKNQDLGGFDSITNILQRFGFFLFFIISVSLIINNKFILAAIFLLTFVSQPIWSAPIISLFYFKGKSINSNFL